MEVMVASAQQIQSNTANLNRVGFASTPETAQTQVSLETPKDEFVKKESHSVRTGAIAGIATALARMTYLEVKHSNISNGYKILLDTCSKAKAITRIATGLGTVIAIAAGIGAGTGAIVKHFTKKD